MGVAGRVRVPVPVPVTVLVLDAACNSSDKIFTGPCSEDCARPDDQKLAVPQVLVNAAFFYQKAGP